MTQEQHGPLPGTQTKSSQASDKPLIFPENTDILSGDEKMTDYSIRHHWFNLLRGFTKQNDVEMLANAKIRSCFPIIDNPTNDCSALQIGEE